MHISWDAAGCLCPVGDFFNYAPPEEDPHHMKNPKVRTENSTKEQYDADTDRLVDAGYDEALASYCFYAKRNYERGDQVLLVSFFFSRFSLELPLMMHFSLCMNIKAFLFAFPVTYLASSST